ncbi:MAG TPA: KH domain-containing protein [Candidatus Nanoarchaeia archaeon]|nr:KH domain-containing protein [Candidatus Nanoarchaeia archaeon]
MYQDELKIPKDRIAVLVGVKGSTKRDIEKKTNTKIKVDSKEGDVFIFSEDSLAIFTAKLIIQAIARGFNPAIALKLLEEDYCIEIIDITAFSRKSKKRLQVLRARLIGSQGKARKLIEQLTNTDIEVYGKTTSIIGLHHDVMLSKQAVLNLLQGSKHGNVYAFIEKQKRMKSKRE